MTTPPVAGSSVIAPALAVGIVLACYGWGWLLSRLVRRSDSVEPTVAELATVGFCVISALGGFIIAAGIFSAVIAVLLLAPAVLSLSLLVTRRALIFGEARTSLGWLACFAVWLLWVYLPPAINGNDDGPAYLAFTRKIVETGGLGPEPFSERRFFSLGGHQIFLAIEQVFLPERWLGIVEPCLGMALCLLVLRDAARRWKAPAPLAWLLAMALLLSNVAGSSVLTNLMPAYLIAALAAALLSSAIDAEPVRAWTAIRIGLLCAALVALRATSLPFAAALAVFTLAPDAKFHPRAWGGAVLAAVVLLAPYMLCSWVSSHTPLFPFLGRGWHGSATSGFPSPTAGTPPLQLARGVLLAPVKNPLAWMTALIALAAWRGGSVRVALLGLVCLATELVISAGTGGTASLRYSFPFYTGYVVIAPLALRFEWRPAWSPWGRRALVAGALLVVVLLGLRWRKVESIVSAKIETRWKAAVPTQEELASYQRAQDAVPPGASILASASRAYLLDFRRNRIDLNDQAGAAGPPPGWPRQNDAVASYLSSQGVDYVLARTEFITEPRAPSEGQGWLQNLSRADERWASILRSPAFTHATVYRDPVLTLFALPRNRD